ncbi:type IV secretory system conjugative DNA transfer family protein [Shewanella oncorhynchi]|uniref:type IV secretory system conjugative DNA transfer family protein n=1 Tax=Shewanella oncorhynchi TaxID=2726434 RepID=UPI003D7A72FF
MNRQLLGIVIVIPVLSTLFLYLAGTIYFLLNKANLDLVTPWTIIDYWQAHHGIELYQKKLNASLLMSAVLTIGIPSIMILNSFRTTEELHGSARFATFREIKKKGLLSGKGILIGKFMGKYLVLRGSLFAFLAAPTRSGKGVAIAIPNLLSWHDSVVLLDLKQEGFSITSKFRAKHGQQVFLFNPFAEDGKTHRYNPLSYVRDGDFCINDILTIANSFYPAIDPRNKFWDEQATNLFLGLALFVKETPELPFTIGELLRQSSGKGKDPQTYLREVIESRQSTNPLSSDCVDALNRFLALSDNSLSNVLGSFNAPLTNWISPIFDSATSESDFDLREVRKQRMSIYIGITPDYLPQASKILNLFFSQLVNLNIKELPEHNSALKYQCLLLMDEFTAMGRIGILAKSVSYIAGYGLRLVTIVQSPAQLEESVSEGGYGREGAKTYMTNHAAQIVFAPKDTDDAEAYSKMIGYKTVKATSNTRNSGRRGSSSSESDQGRAVMLPQEVKDMGEWKQVINMENLKPIFCDKIIYYEDPIFVDRLKSVSPSLFALKKALPTYEQLKEVMRNKELQIDVPQIPLKRSPCRDTSSPASHTAPLEQTFIPTAPELAQPQATSDEKDYDPLF